MQLNGALQSKSKRRYTRTKRSAATKQGLAFIAKSLPRWTNPWISHCELNSKYYILGTRGSLDEFARRCAERVAPKSLKYSLLTMSHYDSKEPSGFLQNYGIYDSCGTHPPYRKKSRTLVVNLWFLRQPHGRQRTSTGSEGESSQSHTVTT